MQSPTEVHNDINDEGDLGVPTSHNNAAPPQRYLDPNQELERLLALEDIDRMSMASQLDAEQIARLTQENIRIQLEKQAQAAALARKEDELTQLRAQLAQSQREKLAAEDRKRQEAAARAQQTAVLAEQTRIARVAGEQRGQEAARVQQLQRSLAARQQDLVAERQAKARIENERVKAVQTAAQRQAQTTALQAQVTILQAAEVERQRQAAITPLQRMFNSRGVNNIRQFAEHTVNKKICITNEEKQILMQQGADKEFTTALMKILNI